MQRLLLVVLTGLLVLLGPATASLLAQTTGTISGVVRDETNAVLPGADITVTNVDTGISRNSFSDDEGRYRVSNLNIGRYEVVAALPGFQSSVRSGITLTMGREAIVDHRLRVGEISERVEVVGEASLVETTSGSLGSVVDRETILELPLNGRDLTGLIALQSGTARATTANTGGSSGFSRHVSIGGARPDANGMLIDGTEVKSVDGGLPAGVSGNFLGGEAIQEFKVERNSYSAQYGGSAGGVINALSKSGTNELHGSLYYFHRNDNLDAGNFRDPTVVDSSGNFAGKAKPEFRRHQYGVSAGGPIFKNRTFFFGNYEGLRESLGFTSFRNVPTLATREGNLQVGPDEFVQIPVDTDVVPYLDLWPLPGPGAVDEGDGTAREPVIRSQPTDENFYQVRVDHNFSESDSIFGRVTRQTSDTYPPGVLRWGKHQWVYNTFITLEEKRIFSPTLLNTFRVSYNRRGLAESGTEEPRVDPSLLFVPADKWPIRTPQLLGVVSVAGLSGLGEDRGLFDRRIHYFQGGDDLIYDRGAHSLKVGFNVRRHHLNGDSSSRRAGDYTFSSLEDFLRGTPTDWRGEMLPGGDSIRGFRWTLFGWYIQDDWQAHPNLTLNLGFRHEFYTVPTEVNGKIWSIRHPFEDSELVVGQDPWWKNPSYKSLMPRIGLAWDPTGEGNMAIRAGAGIFYNHIDPKMLRQAGFRSAPFTLQSAISSDTPGDIPFPGIYDFVVNQGGAEPDIYVWPYDWQRNPHIVQWNLNIQREILPQTAVTLGYAGSRGFNLFHLPNTNVAKAEVVNGRYVFPDDAERPNPNFTSRMRSMEASTNSWYHSFQAQLQRRFQDGWQLQLSYTHSRALDQSSQTGPTFSNEGGGVAYYWDPMMRRSLAAFHVADNFSASWVWMLPLGSGQRYGSDWSGIMDHVLGGWQLGGILAVASGPPVTVSMSDRRDLRALNYRGQKPDLVPGGSNNPVLGDPDEWFDASNFVWPAPRTIGNVGRNTLIGPGLASLDFSLTKNTILSEDVNMQFRAEFFNFLNRANLGTPSSSVFNSRGRPSGSAGFISDTSTTARQIQLGLRLEF